MTEKTFTVATWNISEGHISHSAELFDYEAHENLDYFVAELKKISPDIVCLPETQMPPKNMPQSESLTSQVAEALGFVHKHERPMHHSLTSDSGDMLGLGLVSSLKFTVKDTPLKQPDFPLLFASGKPATPHTRWLFVADFESFILCTTHNWPLKVFQNSYDSEPGASYGRYLEKTYLESIPDEKPLLIAGDLNFDSPKKVMPKVVQKFDLTDALPANEPTRPSGDHPDHILFDPAFDCLEAQIIPGKGDHYLCYARLSLRS